MTARREFLAGARAEVPLLLGVLPFGLIYGALALQAGIPPMAALAMSSIVLAGSAQFVGTQLFAAGAPGALIVVTTFVVNLRHMLYSASVAPYLSRLRLRWKLLLAYLLTDEAYAMAITHYQQTETGTPPHTRCARSGRSEETRDDRSPADQRHWFFLGAGVTLWTTWQVSTALGIYVGARIPESWNLEFALPLTFIALVRPAVTDRATAAAAIAAGVVAVLAHGLALRLGLIMAAVTGIGLGILTERHPPAAPRP